MGNVLFDIGILNRILKGWPTYSKQLLESDRIDDSKLLQKPGDEAKNKKKKRKREEPFQEEFKKALKTVITSTFGIPKSRWTSSDIQLGWDLCYDYVIQNNIGAHTENFCALSGFFRNTLVAALLSYVLWLVGISIWIVAKCDGLVGCWRACTASVSRCILYDEAYPFGSFLIVTSLAFLVSLLLRSGYRQFERRFAVSVYRSFFTSVSKSINMQPSSPAFEKPEDD
jgi:hypothetical protein